MLFMYLQYAHYYRRVCGKRDNNFKLRISTNVLTESNIFLIGQIVKINQTYKFIISFTIM